MNTWNTRDELLSVTHRWYWIVASFLVGVLFGWGVSLIWPAPYRATLDMYVALNAYRTTRDFYITQVADEEFRNLDDYKNWQMGQLNSLAMSDAFLQETLKRLRSEDSYWQNVDVSTLREMLSIAWRNTGDWHFRAQIADAKQASQAVTVWTDVVGEKVAEAVSSAREMVIIDSDLSAVSKALVESDERHRSLLETQILISNWAIELDNKPADQPLTPLEHWNLIALVTNLASRDIGWSAVLNHAPTQDALPDEYLEWLVEVNALISAELALLPQEITALKTQHAELTTAYNLASDQSRALSANLEVGQIKDELPQVDHLRPIGSLMLVGGLLGVLALTLIWIYQITRKTEIAA